MENRKLIKVLIPIFILGFFVAQIHSAFAYNIETHAYLTSEIIKFYNQNFTTNKIPDDLKDYLIDGSRREDYAPRWMNHFYDPVYNRGLIDSVLGIWQKSKDWAQDSNNQNSLTYKVPAAIASILTAIQQKKISALTTETDFTWQRAIKFYVQGEREKAMFTLGHIIHLLEDKAVPDHTRNDPHPGDSPYENYTQQFILNNPDKNLSQKLQNKSTILFNDLNSYFDELANYSNNNFYSKDTIGTQSGYNLPEPDYFGKDGIYYYGFKIDKENKDYHLLAYKKPPSKYLWALDGELTLKDEGQNFISLAYWSRLSTKSVQYGAGVINLFFQEVEKAKNDPNFIKQEEKSFFGQIIDKVKNLTGQVVSTVGDFFAGSFGGNQNFQPVGQVSLEQASSEKEENKKEETGGQAEQNKQVLPSMEVAQNQNQQSLEITQQSKPTFYESYEVQLRKIEQTQMQADLEQKPTQQQPQATNNQQLTTNSDPQSTAFKQCSFNTSQSPSRQKVIINEVAWMRTITASPNDEWIELKNISGGEVDLTNWQLFDADEDIKIIFGNEDKRKIINKKIPAAGFYLLERTNDDSVPGIAADFVYTGVLSNDGKTKPEGLRLFDGQCNLIDEVLASPDWPAGDNNSKRTMERKNDFSWQSSVSPGGTPKAANSSGYIVYSGGGGGGCGGCSADTSTNGSTGGGGNDGESEIKISEIMYDLEGSDSGREWVEIFNAGGSSVDLSGWKFYEDETNHNLNLIQGSATLEAGQYALIADDSGKFLQDYPQYSGTLFDSSFSLSNTGEPLAIKNGEAVINQVNYNSGQGANGDGNSLQLINNEWRPASPTPGQENKISASQSNQPPAAFFVFSPQNPEVNQEIIFNAASSTDPDGSIVLYQWDFGDNQNNTTTQSTIAHSYSTAGDYSVQLTVFDNENANDVASLIISVSAALPIYSVMPADHIVISEILFDAERDDTGKEFIEFYNPLATAVDLTGWRLEYQKENSTSTELLAEIKTGSKKDEDNALISASGFFLLGLNNYEAVNYNKPADVRRIKSLPNGSEGIAVILYNNQGDEVDKVIYDKNSITTPGQSLERKAWQNGECVSAQGEGEFLGNGCDRDYDNDDDNDTTDFEVRQTPNPQNSQSLSEPREISTSITDENWDISYDPDNLLINFNWPENAGLTYEIKEYNSPGISIFKGSVNTFSKAIDEVGRKYKFSIQAFDAEGAGSELIYKEIETPSFIKNVAFFEAPYRDLYGQETEGPLIEFYYDEYPFLPRDLRLARAYGELPSLNYKVLVFYPNSEAPKDEFLRGARPRDENINKVLNLKYNVCYGYYNFKPSLLLADASENCDTGEFRSGSLNFGQYLKESDNHLLFPVQKPDGAGDFSAEDYFTIAYYGFYCIYPQDSDESFAFNNLKLLAVDKIRYYFQNEIPPHQPPTAPSDFQFNFDGADVLTISFLPSTDPDTLDNLIIYQSNVDGENWQNVEFIGGDEPNRKYVKFHLNLREDFHRYFKGVDDFGLTPETAEASWQYPTLRFNFLRTKAIPGAIIGELKVIARLLLVRHKQFFRV